MRAAWCGFSSPLAGDIERYLSAKRALGCKFVAEDRSLRLLDRYLVEQRVPSLGDVSGACLEQFLASRGRVNARGPRLRRTRDHETRTAGTALRRRHG